jgi:hypothetical protein
MEAPNARSEVQRATPPRTSSDAPSRMETPDAPDNAPAPSHAPGGAPDAAGSGPRPLADVLDGLAKPIPERLLETRRQDGQEITYVPWYRAQKILNHYTGGFWEYEISERTFTDTRIMLTVRIVVHTAEGVFHREGTGIESLDVDRFGDPQSNAESMAFRRAAAKWGLGLDLYEGGA